MGSLAGSKEVRGIAHNFAIAEKPSEAFCRHVVATCTLIAQKGPRTCGIHPGRIICTFLGSPVGHKEYNVYTDTQTLWARCWVDNRIACILPILTAHKGLCELRTKFRLGRTYRGLYRVLGGT